MYYIEMGGKIAEMPLSSVYVSVAMAALVGLLFYFFMSYGLFRMASNAGIKNPGYAFIPFYRWLVLGKIVGNGIFFGRKSNKIGLVALIVVAVTVFTSLSYMICEGAGMVKAYCEGYEIIFSSTNSAFYVIKDSAENISFDMSFEDFQKIYYSNAFLLFDNVVYYLNYVAEIAYIMFMYSVWSSIFIKYKPFGMTIAYVLVATIIGASSPILNIGGLFVFIFRNRKPFNMDEYMKRANGGNSYNGNGYDNPYGGYDDGQNSSDPYGRYDGRYADPFGEDDQNKNTGGGQNGKDPGDPFGDL